MLTLSSSRVLVEGRLVPATLEVEEGRVCRVAEGRVEGEDVSPLVLMPALVDAHVHINEPGRTEWEGFATATRAAAAGGVATLVDMPLNSIPVTTTLDALHRKASAAAGQLAVDVAFWGGVVPGNAAELAPMAAAGARGFKCFLCHSGIDDFPRSTEADLRPAMSILREADRPLLVHAELESELRQDDADPRAYATYLHSRPKEWEDRAVAMIVNLVRETGCRAHIVHLSSSTALPILRAARAEGLPITAETCPHYLCLRAEEVSDGDTTYKCAPPIREDANRAALWAALAEGVIDFVVSDHSPCTPALKRLDTGNFLDAWGGIASLQLGLRAVWTEAAARGHDVATISRWMTAGPAALAGLRDRGRIAPGFRADLVAWDPDGAEVVDVARLFHRHPLTPYRDRRLRGRVAATWLAGERVYDGDNIVGPPRGRPLLSES
ncbi:MAG: allantoinase AllB [Deltaproteobacteria bacterium]|nr:allantoinase AllB [Deltaproteobacteria bacterium]